MLRKMLSNISYFKKPDDEVPKISDDSTKKRRHTYVCREEKSSGVAFDRVEPDSTSKQCATSLKLPESIKIYAVKKGSLSDTDIVTVSMETPKKDRKKCKKLKLDIKKASRSMSDAVDHSDSSTNVENTPKHILLDCDSADLFSQRFHGFDFNRSFDIFDAMSDTSSFEEDNVDIESLSDHSETDISLASETECIKMCRKVSSLDDDDEVKKDIELQNQLVPSATPESFGDVELEKNEEERVSLLLNYQMKLEKLECFLKQLLTEFQFHIEVSKVFLCKTVVSTFPGTDVGKLPNILGEVTYIDKVRSVSPTDSWNIIIEKEDSETKSKVKKQLQSIRHTIDGFVTGHLQNQKAHKILSRQRKSITFDLHKELHQPRRHKMSDKKKHRHFDFPDYRDALLNLFSCEDYIYNTSNSPTPLDDSDSPRCICCCHQHSESDSGVTTKEESMSSQSITSSIGNFSLDSSTLTAYSESLDQIVSYNSFQDTSLYSSLLQKAAIERITFYVQVHSIQLKCEQADPEFETKSTITFDCPTCKTVETEENGLLKHILSQHHCEKIHFLYKTAYIKKCVSAGKEIMPSTVLNPMTMYRDDNKIVCFGDAMYACSLCFENLIVGESVLMAHCAETEHIERREKLSEILD